MITIISVTYNQYISHKLQTFLHCIKGQTNPNWKLIVAHDGPSNDCSLEYMRGVEHCDDRVYYFESAKREHDPEKGYGWGHANRARMLKMVDTEWVNFTNSDNLLIHQAIELLDPLLTKSNADVIMFPIVHSHYGYKLFIPEFRLSGIDMCQFVIRTKLAQEVGFNHRDFAADGRFVEDVKKHKPDLKIEVLPAILGVHS